MHHLDRRASPDLNVLAVVNGAEAPLARLGPDEAVGDVAGPHVSRFGVQVAVGHAPGHCRGSGRYAAMRPALTCRRGRTAPLLPTVGAVGRVAGPSPAHGRCVASED